MMRPAMFRLEFDPPGARARLATIILDDPKRSVNALGPETMMQVDTILSTVRGEREIVGAVLISGKTDHFMAGGDLRRFGDITDRRDFEVLARRIQDLLRRVSAMEKPVVAAIHGVCLGGGLEAALACHYRIATDHPSTVLGFAEASVGLIPSGGGLARLPRLIGLRESISLVTEGRLIRARRAKRLGLVDEVVSPEALSMAAREAALALARGERTTSPPRRGLSRRLVEDNPVGRRVLFSAARREVRRKTHGLYPAPLVALDVMERGANKELSQAIALEGPAFAELAVSTTSRNLVALFLRRSDRRRAAAGLEAPGRVGVVGGGTVGAELAAITAEKGMEARVREVSEERLADALARIKRYFDERSRRVGEKYVYGARSRVSGGLGLAGFETMDLVIEAVPEHLELKRDVFEELDRTCRPETTLATNTSALPIESITRQVEHPERVVGLHVFVPLRRMPLVEIVRGPQTSQAAVDRASAYAYALGKTPVVVSDGPGFYTSRVLGFFFSAALEMMSEGHDIEAIDGGARAVGWPMGPFALIDSVGGAVALAVLQTLCGAFSDRLELNPGLEKMVVDGRVGRRTGRGFYVHPSAAREGRRVDETVYSRFRPSDARPRPASDQVLGERLTFVAAAEAVRCLDDGVLACPDDGDVAAVLGFGYPALRGGPFRHFDTIGLRACVDRLLALEDRFGPRFRPPALLRRLAREGETFAGWKRGDDAA